MNDYYINFLVFVFVFCIYYLENRVPFVKLFGFVDTLGAIIEYLVFLISCLSQIAQFWCRMSPGVWEEKWSSTWTLEQTLFSCSSSTNRYLSLLGMDCRLGCCLLMKVCMYDKCWMSDFMIKCPFVVFAKDSYIQSRADTMQNIESTIVELGSIFQQLAHMVKEQEETIQRSDNHTQTHAHHMNMHTAKPQTPQIHAVQTTQTLTTLSS